jgi:hypothetical protein
VAQIGVVSVTTTLFNYEALKALYERKRTVYIPRVSSSSDRTVMVSAMNRMVYVERTSSPFDRTSGVADENRYMYVPSTSTKASRTALVE